MKNELTVEESKILINLGVDPKLASVNNAPFKNIPHLRSVEISENPIFTLTDILSILPKEIDDDRTLSMEYDKEFNQWCVGYNLAHLEWASELIDALFALLKHVTKNKVNG